MLKNQRTEATRAPKACLGSAWFAALLIGCGGATPEAETPVEEPPPEAALEQRDGAPEDEALEDEALEDEASAEMGEDGASSSDSLSPEDFQAALQIVIQDDALQNAMNLTEPGRFPIKISGEGLPSNLQLTAGEKAVEIVPAPEDPKKEPVLVFSKIDVSGNRVSFKYRYDIEGMRGTSTVSKKDGIWELKASRISEY